MPSNRRVEVAAGVFQVGDQVVTIQVRTPTNLTAEQRHLLLELGKTLDREVVPQKEKSFFDRIRDALGM